MPFLRRSIARYARLLPVATLWVAIQATPRHAHAQHTSTPPPDAAAASNATAAARATFDRGVAALDELRFADAVTALEESNRLRPLPVVTYDLGLAYRGLGRNLAAIDAFEHFLRNPGPSPHADMLNTVRDQIAALRRSLVVLTVAADPAEAMLLIDGRQQGSVGHELTLDPGPHAVEARADGYRPHREEVTFPPSAQITLNMRLEPLEGSGRIIVEPSVAEAVVTIDGRRTGTGNVERPLAAGDHVIDIRAEHYLPFHRTIHMGQLGLVRVEATLVRPGTPGWVTPVAVGATVALLAAAVLAEVFVKHSGDVGSWGNFTVPSAMQP